MNPAHPAENLFVDLSDRTKLRLTGEDRLRFLNGQVSNDLRLATRETAVYTGVMTIKGKLCADAFVHVEGEALAVDAEAGVRESLAARLEKYIIADDVELEDVTEAFGLFHLLDFYDEPEPERRAGAAARAGADRAGSAGRAGDAVRAARVGRVLSRRRWRTPYGRRCTTRGTPS